MSSFDYLVICFAIPLVQNTFGQYFMNRNFCNMYKGASGQPFSPYPATPYNEVCQIPFTDYGGPVALIPQPLDAALAYPEYVEEVAELVEYTDYVLPEPSSDDYCINDLALVEDETVMESPFLTAIGYGAETLALALNPLRDAADSNVALVMFTKVRTI